MLRTRLWMGAILIGLTVATLVADQWFAPWYPFLFGLVLGLGLAGCYELRALLPPPRRPPAWLSYLAVAGLVVANWPANVWNLPQGPWPWVVGVLAAVVLLAFLAEMTRFHEPGESVP